MPDEPQREPRLFKRTATDSLSASDAATRQIDASRKAEDGLRATDTVEARVAQAQAMIATAIGRANDATVRIEELGEQAPTPEERDFAAALAKEFKPVLEELRSMNDTLGGFRSEASEGGFKARRVAIILGGGGLLLTAIGIFVGILIAQSVIR